MATLLAPTLMDMLATLPTLLPMGPMVTPPTPMATLDTPVPMVPTLTPTGPTPTWDKEPVHLPPYSCRTHYLFIQHVQRDIRQPMIVIRVSSTQPVTKRSSAPPTEAAGDTRGTRVIHIMHFTSNNVVDVLQVFLC